MKIDTEKVGVAVVDNAVWDKIWLEKNWDRVNVMSREECDVAMKRLGEIRYIEKVDDEWMEKVIKGE